MNLKSKCQPAWHEHFHKSYVAIYIALALVLIINHSVFSYLLKDREAAKAFTSAISSGLFINLHDREIAAGTTDVKLAELWVPAAQSSDVNIACGFRLDNAGAGYDNLCLQNVDFDGPATVNEATSRDGAEYILTLLDPTLNATNSTFQIADNTCADSLTNPQEVYVDGSGDCITGNGGTDIIILDKFGTIGTLDAVGYSNVALGAADGNLWIHSELTKRNAAYDYNWSPSNNSYYEDTAKCGGVTPGTFEIGVEPIWGDVADDGVFDPVYDIIIQDPSNCLTSGRCSQGGCAGVNANAGLLPVNTPYFYDGGGACPGTPGDGRWESGEPIWLEGPGVGTAGIYDGADAVALDPSSCLSLGLVGTEVYPEMTEAIWIANTNTLIIEDAILQQGSGWGDFVRNRHLQNDPAGAWVGLGSINGEGFIASTPNVFTGSGGANEPVIIDVDNSGTYTAGDTDVYSSAPAPVGQALTSLATANGPSVTLPADCDGSATTGVGSCPGAVVNGTPLTGLVGGDNICTDSLSAPAGVYIDGDGDCTWGSGGADTNLLADCSGGSCTNSVAGNWRFYDINSNGGYDDGEPIYYDPVTGIVSSQIYKNYQLIYADSDGSGNLTSADTILEDRGTIYNGPLANNSVIDRLGDMFNRATFKNLGTAQLGRDVTNVRFCANINGDGICDLTDTCIGNIGIVAGQIVTDFSDLNFPIPVPACVFVDIPSNAITGTTIRPGVPKLNDVNSNGVYDPGDEGIFYYSFNSGPTDADTPVPYTYTIVGGTSQGDAFPPDEVTNLSATSDPTGKVILKWTDPVIGDLGDILIYRDHNLDAGQVGANVLATVAKGVQTFTDLNLTPGETYIYLVKAVDTTGNINQGVQISVKVLTEGEILPSPGVSLPDNLQIGDLVKIAKVTSVYIIGADGKRHPYPTADVYRSYFKDFSGVKTITNDILSKIPLGNNVTVKPGTYLVRLKSSSKVYAVEPDGVLGWIQTDQLVRGIYSKDWAKRTIVLPEAFFIDYRLGDDIVSKIFPSGTLLKDKAKGVYYYVEGNKLRMLSEAKEELASGEIRSEFVIELKNIVPADYHYVLGEPIKEFPAYNIALKSKGKSQIPNLLQRIFQVPEDILSNILSNLKK